MQTKFIDNLRDKTKKAKKKLEKRYILNKLKSEKSVKQWEKIYKFSDENPEKAADIFVEKILTYIEEMAEEGKNQYNWLPVNYRHLQDMVVAKLKKMGLKLKVCCGHGHGGYLNGAFSGNVIGCKGTNYESCFREIIISW